MGEVGPPGLKGLQVSDMSHKALILLNVSSTLQSLDFIPSFLMPLFFLKLIFQNYILFQYYFLILGRYWPARRSRSRWTSGSEGKFKSFRMQSATILLKHLYHTYIN